MPGKPPNPAVSSYLPKESGKKKTDKKRRKRPEKGTISKSKRTERGKWRTEAWIERPRSKHSCVVFVRVRHLFSLAFFSVVHLPYARVLIKAPAFTENGHKLIHFRTFA
ncbi:hypothetical protein QS257_03940 [Terrilactibacillus sp. S3-3]|nr:hypothetical protein QS257_03940 [Terrilactibacillus sp. S3-3]